MFTIDNANVFKKNVHNFCIWKWIIMKRKEIVRKLGIFCNILFSKWLALKAVTMEFKTPFVVEWYQSTELENKRKQYKDSIFTRGSCFFDFVFT